MVVVLILVIIFLDAEDLGLDLVRNLLALLHIALGELDDLPVDASELASVTAGAP